MPVRLPNFGGVERRPGHNSILIIGCGLVVSIISALILPENILEKSSALTIYVAYVANLVPSVNAFAAISLFPQVTKTVLAIILTFAPMQTVMLLASRTISFDYRILRKHGVLYAVCLFVTLATLIWVTSIQGIDPSIMSRNTIGGLVLSTISRSRVGLGIVGGAFGFTIGGAIALLLEWLKVFPVVYFSKGGHES